MTRANREKYRQNPISMSALLVTGNTKIAEASKDGKWGIGFSLFDPDKVQELKWGHNKLGKVLMELRSEFTRNATRNFHVNMPSL